MLIRVYYDDTDACGIVYHANYLKFCERARSELFFKQGKSPALNGGHFVVKHIEADYKKPAKLGDMLEAKHKIISIKNSSLVLKQSIWIEEIQIFEMVSVLVYVIDNRPAKLTKETKEFLESIF
ncbi:MAG: YbgC/FadM family acyl-CoA thioesterase [Sulfurospirillum sp.]|nr:YbgC/FadM family acyl-CoA thioesterase [Sulfurospirillum sp.]